MYARQVGFLVGVGPIFVAPIGTESKVAILQCSVESRGWVTRIMAPEHVTALNNAGGGRFPYSVEQCSIEGYNNLDYVTLGTNSYLLPNFSQNYQGYTNLGNDWKSTTFTAPNVIRNQQEWNYYGGNPGTPPTTTPTTGTTVPTQTPVYSAPAETNSKGMTYLGIGLVAVLLLVVIVYASK